MPATIAWRNALPKKPGWYWEKSPGNKPGICQVFKDDGVLKVRFAQGFCCPIEYFAHLKKWAGPIPMPGETRDAKPGKSRLSFWCDRKIL